MQDSKDMLSTWHEGCTSKSNERSKPMQSLRICVIAMKATNEVVNRIETSLDR